MPIPADTTQLTELLEELKANLVVVNVALQRYINTRDIDYLERAQGLCCCSAPAIENNTKVCCDAR